MEEMKITKIYLLNKTENQIKETIKMSDSEKWKEEKQSKSTLEIYNKFKANISDEHQLYDNTEESIILYRARSNTLPLNWRNRFKTDASEDDQICPLCNDGIETLEHFLLVCENQMTIRNRYEIWSANSQDEKLVNILCFNGKLEGRKLLKELWTARRKKIENAAS